MRITERELRRIVREEILREGSSSYFRSPANAPFDPTAGVDIGPEGQRRAIELFLQEHPRFEETLLARPIDRQAEFMLVLRALRDLVGRERLGMGETPLRDAAHWLLKYFRNTDEYVRRRG